MVVMVVIGGVVYVDVVVAEMGGDGGSVYWLR